MQEEIVDQADAGQKDVGQVVVWLSRQREVDREQLAGMAREIERLTQAARDQAAQVALLGDELRQQRALASRLPAAEEQVRQLREQIGNLSTSVSEHDQQADRQVQSRATEWERDRRTIIEQGQRIAELYRQNEVASGRLQSVTEELKRDRATVAPLAQAVDDLERRVVGLVGRLQQTDEAVKRVDNQWTAAQQRDESVRADLARLENWQRLADVRWTRQLADRQQQVDAMRTQIDEQVKPVQQIAKQIVQLREGAEGFASQVGEIQKRSEEQAVTLQRIDGQLGSGREGVVRLEQVIDIVRRRADEQSNVLLRLEEKTRAEVATIGEFERRLEDQRARQAELSAVLAQTLERQRRIEDTIGAVQQQMRERRIEVDEEFASLSGALGSQGREIMDRLTEWSQADLDQRARRIRAMRDELEELGALVGKLGISASVSADEPGR